MNKNDAPACSFGADRLLKQVQAFQQEADGVRSAEDIESIRRMRVASRRLRSALPLFAGCFRKKQVRAWLKAIQTITRALGEARDSDVQLALLQKTIKNVPDAKFLPGIRRLALRIFQRRQGLQAPIVATLDQLEQEGILAALEQQLTQKVVPFDPTVPFPHSLYVDASAALQQRLEVFLQFEPYVHQAQCVSQLHAMRIAAKHLRYTSEVFAPLYPAALQPYIQPLRESQDLLGDIHDCDVWQDFLPRFIEEERERIRAYFGHTRPLNSLLPGFEYFRQNRQELREKRFIEFGLHWQEWQSSQLWTRFKQALDAHLHQEAFPPIQTE